MEVSYKMQELLTLREHVGSRRVTPGIVVTSCGHPLYCCGVYVAHHFSFLCSVCVLGFVCLVSCVPNVAIVSRLSIPGLPLTFIYKSVAHPARLDILITCGKQIHDCTNSLRRNIWADRNSLTQPLLLKCLFQVRHVSSHICMLGVSFVE
jgi:hypothetical protein